MIDVITFTFTLLTILLFSLIDSGSTHSYMSSELTCELGLPVGTIDKGMTTTSSFGESVLVNRVYCRTCLFHRFDGTTLLWFRRNPRN